MIPSKKSTNNGIPMSHVGMEMCFVCGESTGALALDRQLKARVPERFTSPTSLCRVCTEHQKTGVVLFDDAGNRVILKEEAFRRIFEGVEFPPGRLAKCEVGLLAALMKAHEETKEPE